MTRVEGIKFDCQSVRREIEPIEIAHVFLAVTRNAETAGRFARKMARAISIWRMVSCLDYRLRAAEESE